MFLSKISIHKPVLMTMVIMTFVVLGVFAYLEIPVDLTPDVDFPVVTVSTIYPGAGPEEIETLITEPVEEEVSSIAGVKNVRSISREGISVVIVEFEIGTKTDVVAVDVRDKVDALRPFLPEDAKAPTVQKFDLRALPILDIAVSSPRPLEEVYQLTDEVIKDRLSTIDGVASVNITGGKEREILVSVDRDRLKAYDLSIMEIVGAIASANLNIPGGHITEARKEYTVRLAGEFEDVDRIREIKLSSRQGPVKLSEVAEVLDSFKEQRSLARFNGQPSVGISIIKRGDANTVRTANRVKSELERLKKILPPDVRFDLARDRSVFIQAAIDDVMSNMLLGILLTAFVLYLFLHNLRGTVIAAVAMPTSIIATFNLIRFAGFTINFMSLLGLAISVGVLVTSAIVVLENIHRHLDRGDDPKIAADKGTSEIAIAVLASLLTNVVVFTPIAFMKGIVGQFFKQFGLTVVFSSLFSLLVAFTLTPMMASKLLAKRREPRGLAKRIWEKWDRFYTGLEQDYQRTLKWAIRHPVAVSVVVTVTFCGSLFLVRFVGSEFITRADEGVISITVEMPAGTSLQATNRALERIEATLSKFPEVKSVYTVLGKIQGQLGMASEGVELGEVTVQLVDENQRERSTTEVVRALRPMLADIPGAKIFVKETNPFGGGGVADMQIEITGTEMGELTRIAEDVMRVTQSVPGMVDINSSWKIGKPEVRIVPDREKIAEYGVSVAQVAAALRTGIEGQVASEYRVGDKEYDIRVRFADADKANVRQVRDVAIKAGDFSVPITELAAITEAEGPTQIERKNKERLVTVTANIAQGTLGEKQRAIQQGLTAVSLGEGYRIFFGGQSERQAESFGYMFQALILAILLTYMVLAAILESYIHPITIMMTLPLGLVGVILSLVITNTTLSIFSLMAMVMLVGIVVNNAILLIDYITVLRGEGKSLDEAILEACPVRLRPIIMTNLATALGMLPLALGIGRGAETRAPMAIVSIGALITSAVFTLYLIPMIYRTTENWKLKWSSWRARKTSA